jgi:hypothetical protein
MFCKYYQRFFYNVICLLCQNFLEFQISNGPMYHLHRVFIRLQHKSSFDYNTSAPALIDDECWIYYADTKSVADDQLNCFFF